jgi:hypothetical protein
MIDRDHELPLSKQAAALGISRGSLYYEPRPVSAADLALMRRMDELHLEFPFAGSRMLQGLLAEQGGPASRENADAANGPGSGLSQARPRHCCRDHVLVAGRSIIIESFAHGCRPTHRPTPTSQEIRIDTS